VVHGFELALTAVHSGVGHRRGAGAGRLIVDIDSFIGEVHGYQARRVLRLHPSAWLPPALATRADTGEVLHIRLRKGSASSPRDVLRFVEELIARVARAGARRTCAPARPTTASGNKRLIARPDRAGWLLACERYGRMSSRRS